MSVLLILYSITANAQICSVNAGVDKTICVNQQPLILSGYTGSSLASPPVYLWTKLSGPSAFISIPDSLSTNVTGLTPGNYVFQLSCKCIDGLYAKDIIAVTVLPEPPTAIAGIDINLCFNAPVQLSANAVNAPYIGTWTVSPAGGSFSPNANSPNAIFTALPRAGVKRFTWTISNGTCSKSDVMTVTYAEPTVPVSAGPDDTLSCEGPCAYMRASYEGYAPQNGLWTIVSGPNTPIFSDLSSSASKVCNLVPGNYVFRWTVSGPCINGSDEMTLYVENIKSPPFTLGDQVYTGFCEEPGVTTEVLMGDPLAIGDTVTWLQTGGGTVATFSPDNHHSFVTVGNLTGTFPYKFTYNHITVSGCNVTTTHTIYRSQIITGLTYPPDQELPCDVTNTTFNVSFNKLNTISNSVTRRAMLITGPIDSGRIDFTNSTVLGTIRTDTWTVTNLVAAGTYIYRVEYSNACGSFFQDIAFTVSRTPGNVNAGSDIILPCHGINVTPTGSVNSPGIFTWSQVDGPNIALLTGEHSLTPSLDGLIQGVYTIRLANWGGNMCPVNMDDMKVTVTQLPPLNATIAPDTAICAGNYQLTANIPLTTETGIWSVSPSTGISFSPDEHTPTAYVTGLHPGSNYTFTWTVSNACGSLSAIQNVTTGLFLSAPVPDAGADFCEIQGTSITTLSGNNPGGADILWTALSPGSTVFPVDQQATQATFTGSGEYLFEYTLGTAGCGTFRDTVQVTIKSDVQIDAGADMNICTASLPHSVIMNAGTSSLTNRVTAIWTQLSGPSIAVISAVADPHAVFSNLIEGIYQFEYRKEPGSICEYIADTIAIRISAQPSDAVAGPDQSICNATFNTIVNLAATTPVTGVGYWQIISGPPASVPPVFSNPNAANCTIRYLTQGTYHLRWTTTNGPGCPAKTDDMDINISALAESGINMAGCNAAVVQLSGNPNTNGTWSFVSGPPGAIITANSGNNAIVSGLITTLVPAVYRFRYSLPDIGNCPASSDDIIFTNYLSPSQANSGGNRTVCSDETSVTLSGNTPSMGTASWLFQSGPNNPVSGLSNNVSSDTILNNLVPGIYVYQYRVRTNAVCPVSTENIQIIKQAKANAQADSRICNVSVVNLDANVPLTGQGTWSYISGALAPGAVHFSDTHNPASSVSGLVPGVYIFRWTIDTIGTCTANYDDIQVTIDPPVSPVSIGPDRVFCQGTMAPFAIGAIPVPGITYTWSPSTLLSSSGIAQPVFQGVNNSGNFIYTLKSSIGSCESFSTISIHVKPTPFANIESTDHGCSASFIASPPGNGVSSPLYNWNFGSNSTPSIATGQGPHYIDLHNAANRNISLEVISSDGCSNSSSIMYVPLCLLPINLASFDAVWKENFAELSWKVESAVNFDHFEIEKSYDGRIFSFLHTTSYIDNVHNYMYPDKAVNASVYTEVFYRLKMVDRDDNFSYSGIKKINLQKNENNLVSVWPNPFVDKIKIKFDEQILGQNFSVKIYNAFGETMIRKTVNTNQSAGYIEIRNLDMLASGFYTLQIISDNKIIINYKIIKRAY